MAQKKRLIVLGSTGSIGTCALQVARDFSDMFDVVGLSTHRNTQLLASQVAEFQPEYVCVSDAEVAVEGVGGTVRMTRGTDGLVELVDQTDADILLVATVGFAGLFPTFAGIRKGMRIALANKEVLVVAGTLVMAEARLREVEILPVDSEHSAILQCLWGHEHRDVRRIILTASGGPFRTTPADQMRDISVADALRHPTWEMGRKITVDSATLMNKGLEVIEACHLFDVPPEAVDVVVHPQSAIHSMVEFNDRSILAHMGPTDMYLPILNALGWPERLENKYQPLDLAELGCLEFEPPDPQRFPCLAYAFEAARAGGVIPAVLNAANEVAVAAFLAEKIRFTDIAETVRTVMDSWDRTVPESELTLETLREVDGRAREMAEQHAGNTQ